MVKDKKIFIALIALGKKLFLCLSVLVLIEMNRPLLRLEKRILLKGGVTGLLQFYLSYEW